MPKVMPTQHPLQQLLLDISLTQSAFSAKVEVKPGKTLGPSSFSLIVNHGIWPKLASIAYIKTSMRTVLSEHGAQADRIEVALDALALPEAPRGSIFLSSANATLLEDSMILRRQVLTPEALRHFGLFRSPFLDEIRKASDVFFSRDIRYVRETMWQVATHADFVAVVGESGSGKTTLLRELRDRIRSSRSDLGGEFVIIEPKVVGMSPTADKGSPLKALHICNAVIRTLAPQLSLCSNSADRFEQLEEVLRTSHQSGNRHLIVIEEAHDLPRPTLKQLKRLNELELGFDKLCGVLLVGQPELKTTLTKNIFDVREVVQRLMLVELLPLDNHLEEYVAHKLKGASKDLDEVFEPEALEAMRDRLQVDSGRRDKKEWVSMVYPLAVNNLATAAMNSAAEVGKKRVTSDIVKEL